ncbi:hypothetical protein TNCV_5039491 [Trichonephila clavipes]|nr:hypothetical protein TNCV_5039491 [Trichonephila clavipes]
MALVHVQSCLSESDCKEDECCAAPHPKALKYGTCLKLGKEKKNILEDTDDDIVYVLKVSLSKTCFLN